MSKEHSLPADQLSDHIIEETRYTLHRRFDRMGRLVGDEKMEKLFNSKVMIIGLGGVGSWAAESLIRSGIGHVDLVDFDEVCITNSNRQLQAMSGTVGKKKVEILSERLRKINPQAAVFSHPIFFNHETADHIFSLEPEYIIDAIDNLTAKCLLLSMAKERGIKTISCLGSAGKMDPLQIRVTDLAKTEMDPLAHAVRKTLRSKFSFPPEGKEFGIPSVFSIEPHELPIDLHYDKGQGFKCVCPQGSNEYHSCEKRNVIYGSASFVTGAFGLQAAALIVKEIVRGGVWR